VGVSLTKLPRSSRWESMLTESYSITKLMGESFKLHSIALAGYEEENTSHASTPSTPEMSTQNVPELELETAVY
jgi:hypothetical protein